MVTMMNGYIGKLLFVNLSTGEFQPEDLDESVARQFLGGPGLGAKILYDRMPAHADVFGEESMLGFVSGPLNNTAALFGGRYTVVSKSPVTGGWNDANSGGRFGKRLKQSGYDAIFFNGISEKPVYLLVDNGEATLLDASDLWGLTVRETEEKLTKKHGDEAGIALIGPAGENLSNMAAIMNDGHRAAARGGSGAVMGSKKLKAVVVKGSQKTPVADASALAATNLNITVNEINFVVTRKDLRDFVSHGTGGTYADSVVTDDAGFRNWTATDLLFTSDDAKKIDSKALDKYKKKKYICSQCEVGCSVYMNMNTDRWGKLETTRPEYETMGAFGSLMLCNDPEAVCKANDLCNQYGFDTISAGSTIAWAMECCEKGVLSKDEMDGIELTWGSGDAIVSVMEKMCKNEGIGKALAMGSRKAAEILGRGQEFLVVANGIEQPQHDPRLIYGLGRTYIADPTPGRHVKASAGGMTTDKGFDPVETLKSFGEDDASQVVETEIMNASGSCAFGYSNAGLGEQLKESVNAVTGFGFLSGDYSRLGYRIFALRHAFNLREGIKRSDWSWSDRMTRPSFHAVHENIQLDFNLMVDAFYEAMGYTKEGVPTLAKLKELGGLEDVIADLYGES